MSDIVTVIENNEPLVLTMEDCLTEEECEHMISISKPLMKKALSVMVKRV